MKLIAAASLLSLSLFSSVVSADVATSGNTSGGTIVIYASSMEEAQRKIESLEPNGASTIIILLKNADGTTSELRGVNFEELRGVNFPDEPIPG